MNQSGAFCRRNPLCCFSTSVYCCKRIFRYDSVRKLLDTPSYVCLGPEDSYFCRNTDFRFYSYLFIFMGIALGYGLDDRGSRVRFPGGGWALGPTQPLIQWVPGALSVEVKRPGREAHHSPPSSAEVKNAWIYTSTPPILLHGVVFS
jgi:hypothetical protein